MGRRFEKKVEQNGEIALHEGYIYHGYLQIACTDLLRSHQPALWYITWDPTQPTATRPLAIQKDGTWYTYGWDLTKNITEIFTPNGLLETDYVYTPYGAVRPAGSIEQPLQWSSEVYDPELALNYYNFRYYNPTDGRWTRRDPIDIYGELNIYNYINNNPIAYYDLFGLKQIECNNGNLGEMKYSLADLNFSQAGTNKPFKQIYAELISLLRSIDQLDELISFGSFATANNAREVMEAVTTFIMQNNLSNSSVDQSWLRRKLEAINNGLMNGSRGAAIDVDIMVEKCTCRNIFMSLFLSKYYWDKIDTKTFSYVVMRNGEVVEKDKVKRYDRSFPSIKIFSEISGKDIQTAVKKAKEKAAQQMKLT